MPAHRTVVIPFGGPVPDGMESYEDFIETGDPATGLPEIDETDGCAMCYTSGTTGDPKGVIYSHRGMVLHSMVGAQPDMLNFSMNDCILPVVPMFHANAWGIPYAATMTGAKLVFPGPHLDPDSLIAQFIGEKVTFSGGVPTVWLGIIQTIEKDPPKYEALRGLRTVVGGSAAPPAVIRRFQDFGITVLHAWGMTEMSPLGTVANVKPHLSDQGEEIYFDYRSKQGYAAPFVDLRHRDGDGNILPWDGESMGELEVRGPWIASSYFNYPEAGDRWSDDGWFRTGDIVTMDGEGYVQITDRSKDVIKSGGEWISSVDLENAIMGHPAVKEAAVIALPHTKWDERPLACIVLKDGAALTKAELDGHLLSDFAKWQLPDDIVMIDEVPKTSTGKFQKLTLRNRFADWRWGADARKAG
ncbi:MAG: AMP-binding protein, partial [Rhodospirillaceae bacterium]|nr:AMP-binding protein [Rhodospirillaceae bacterium]